MSDQIKLESNRSAVTKVDPKKRKRFDDSIDEQSGKHRKVRKIKRKFASIEPEVIIDSSTKRIHLPSLQQLILYLLTSSNSQPDFCKVINRRAVSKVLFIEVRGLNCTDFGVKSLLRVQNAVTLQKDHFRQELVSFSNAFDYMVPMTMPGSNHAVYPLMTSLVSVHLSNKERKRIVHQNSGKEATLDNLCLKLDQLIASGYPIHKDVTGAKQESVDKTSDYVSTVKFDHPGAKVFSLDCEMCRAESGLVLTRCSLTNWDGKRLIDELVKPDEHIVDYVTKYSGITEEMLKDVKTRLPDIQQKIKGIVSSDDILIGHSLQSDLNVLKMKHPRIIDTAECYDHGSGPPMKPALKSLIFKYFGKTIHDKATGHDSVEDCTSCLDLVKLKLEKGLFFGKSLKTSIFSNIAHCNKMETTNEGEKIPKSSLVIDSGLQLSGPYGPDELVQCKSDDEEVEMLQNKITKHDLILMKLRELEFSKGISSQNDGNTESVVSVEEAYSNLGIHFDKIYNAVPANTLIIVCASCGDLSAIRELQSEHRSFQLLFGKNPNVKNKSSSSDWTQSKAQRLDDAVYKVRSSFCFLTLKK